MTQPPPEVCERIRALHVLLGFLDGQDEKRIELLQLVGAHGMTWNSLPEFFAGMKVSTATPLPVVDSDSCKKRFLKVCQLHASMGSSSKDGAAAHKKLIEYLAKQRLTWSSDLPAILAADWTYRNQASSNSATTSQSSVHTTDFTVLDFVLALFEDHLVMTLAQRVVAALWAFHCYVYYLFEYRPRLGVISPDSGYGKTTYFVR